MRTLTSALMWLPATLAISACSTTTPQSSLPETRIERQLVNHALHIDIGEPPVMTLPQRTIRVTEQSVLAVTEYSGDGAEMERYSTHQSVPWSSKAVEVIVGDFVTTLETDIDGMLRLNLLDEPFVELDYESLRAVQLVAQAEPAMRAEANLLISRELRTKLQEAVTLIYDSLEDDDVEQWVSRVERLSEMGLLEESSQLENMLILLTTGDPQLQGDFVQALGPGRGP